MITLELSDEAAQTLRAICANIGGSSLNSRRLYTDEITVALDNLGIHYSSLNDVEDAFHFIFKDFNLTKNTNKKSIVCTCDMQVIMSVGCQCSGK